MDLMMHTRSTPPTRAAERIVGARGKYKKWGAHSIDCVRGGLGARAPGNFAILHALKCVLGASEASFRAYIQYIHTCQLSSSFSGAVSDRKVRRTGP